MDVKICGGFFKMSELEGTVISMKYGLQNYLLLRFYEPMVITIDGKEIITEKDAFIIYPPFVPQCYRSVSGCFTNDYVSFIADSNYIKKYNLPLNEVIYSNNPDDISEKICFLTWMLTDVLVDHTEQMREQLDITLKALQESLVLQTAKSKREHMMKKQFIALREEIKANPIGWTVEKMSDRIYLTRSHFSIQYKQQFGVSPRDDLLNFTMEYAKKLLDETNLPVSEISEKCGYVNSNNFIRAFKNATGITPLKYRNDE